MPRGGGEVPNAVLAAGVEVGPVGAADFTLWVLNFVLTATCLDKMSPQDKTTKELDQYLE